MVQCVFVVKKGKGDPKEDRYFPYATPFVEIETVKGNLIHNDDECYWWVSECPCAPQVGWVIHTPNKPCELKEYGAPVRVTSVELWSGQSYLTVYCS